MPWLFRTGEGEKEDGHGFEGKLDKDQLLTSPDEAEAFVSATGVDALAVTHWNKSWCIQIHKAAGRGYFIFKNHF